MKPIGSRLWISLIVVVALMVAGCSQRSVFRQPDGYYGGDRPPKNLPVDPASVQDAVPRNEPLSKTGNKPYQALGKQYRPLKSGKGYVKKGMASWYGEKFHGRRTSSGEPYDMFAMTAAHPILPLPSYVRVTNLDNGKSVIVKVNDRGPFLHGRIIDLSYVAAHKLGIAQKGTGRVEVRAIEATSQSAAINTISGYAGSNLTNAADADAGARASLNEPILIQIGAYSYLENALNMRQLLNLAGFQVVPIFDDTDSSREQTIYRVRVGPFASHSQALQNKRRLEVMLGHPVALVVN